MEKLEQHNELEKNLENSEEKAPVQKKLWNNVFFLGLAIFLFAPIGIAWMWVDKGFNYKKITKIIVTTLLVLAMVATVFLRNAAIAKYPELEGEPNTIIIQKVLEK